MLTHTIKKGLGLIREETEHELSPEEFERLWPSTEGRRIRKERLRVPHDGLVWELDRFLDLDLFMAEVELPGPDHPVTIPPWLESRILKEVTDEPAYRNFELASRKSQLDSDSPGSRG